MPGLALIVASPATAAMVESAGVEVMDLEQLAGHLATLPATAPDVHITGDDLCYAVFTSGSTGTPKLTAVRHEGWFNLMNWLQLEYGLHPGSHNLVVSAFGFDLSQRALMTPLFCGATQHLMASRSFDAMLAYRMLNQYDVRVVHCASSTLYLLVDWENARGGDALARLDYILFGGEALKSERLAHFARRPGTTCTLLHQYGVAECTDVATSYDLARYRPGEHDIAPVGRPAHNTAIHLLDAELREVEAGQYGEICISGAGVGAGYLAPAAPRTPSSRPSTSRGRRCACTARETAAGSTTAVNSSSSAGWTPRSRCGACGSTPPTSNALWAGWPASARRPWWPPTTTAAKPN